MSKKIFNILLCLLLAFSLVFAVACANEDNGGDDSSDTATDTATDTTTDTDSDEGTNDSDTDTSTDTGSDEGTNDSDTDTSTDTSTNEPEEDTMYKVTFVPDNGEQSMEYEVKAGNVLITVPKNITKDGYTFEGWLLDGQAWNDKSPITSDITLTAKWVANDNILRFNINVSGDNTAQSITIKTGETINLPAVPFSRDGYEFLGWAETATGVVKYQDQGEYTMGSSVAQLYAVWDIIEYQIAYDIDDDVINHPDNPTSFTVESVVTFKAPTKEGWSFVRWEYRGNTVETTEGIFMGMTLTAVWEREAFEVTYNYGELVQGLPVTNENPRAVTCVDDITLQDASCTGFTFVGWFSDAELTTEVTKIEPGVDAAFTLYAKFEVVTYNITYTLDDGVTTTNPATYNYNQAVTFADPTVTKVGYVFDGWYINDEKVTEIKAHTLTGDITVVAQLKPIAYTITYVGADGLMPEGTKYTYTVEDEATVALPTIEIAGVTFNGWFTDSAFAESSKITEITLDMANPQNISVYLSVDMTKYNISYVYPDGIDVTGIVNPNPSWYADAVQVTLKDVTLDGYKFEGWYKEATFENVITSTEGLTGDITVYAKLKVAVTKITVDQIASTETSEGGVPWGNTDQLFDGDYEYSVPNNWHSVVNNGWAGIAGTYVLYTFDAEYYVTSATLYYWSNWAGAIIEFIDAEGNETFEFNGNLSGGDCVPFTLDIGSGVLVKQVKISVTHAKGVKNMSFTELFLNVGEAPAVEETLAE